MESDFSTPLGLLSDCHRRIEKFLEQIIRVCETEGGGALQNGQREALEVALRYFRQAAPLHAADEEASLFPRLREQAQHGDAIAAQAGAIMERLEADHDTADEQHAVIDEIGRRWLEQGALAAADATRLKAEARALRDFYTTHIAIEDRILFPLAGQLLAPEAIDKVVREMAARRGLYFDNLPSGSSCAARRLAGGN
jgi:hemerythrin-like domain-containing protein